MASKNSINHTRFNKPKTEALGLRLAILYTKIRKQVNKVNSTK